MNEIKKELQSTNKNYKVAPSALDEVVKISTVVAKEKNKMLRVLGNSYTGLKQRVNNEFYEQYRIIGNITSMMSTEKQKENQNS